jgi:GT2 family glycosyltransferase
MVSLIIPTFNRSKWLKRCLIALRSELKSSKCEIIVIDDGSTDSTAHFLEKFSAQGKIDFSVFHQQRGGPARARNFGVRMARGSIVCFLDDDSIVQPGWFGELEKVFDHINDQYVAVKGKVKTYQNDPLPKFLEEHIHVSNSWATNNIAFRKDVFMEIDGFDEGFTFAAWEDLDLGFRLERLGYRRFYNPDMIVRHPHEDGIEKLKRKFRVNGYGYYQFCKKWIRIDPALVIRMWLERLRVLYYLLPSMERLDYLRYIHGVRIKYEITGMIQGIFTGGRLRRRVKD